MKFVGIDPGLTGAIAILSKDNLCVIDMPTVRWRDTKTVCGVSLAGIFTNINSEDAVVALEKAQSFSGEGRSSLFTYGVGYGVVFGVLCTFPRVAVHEIAAADWKRACGLTSNKGDSLEAAKQIFKNNTSLFARKKDHGRAEAALLAYYASRVLR